MSLEIGKKMASIKDVYEAHGKEYGGSPKVVVSAPGRFNIMGERSCWFFKDKTISMAVNLNVFVAISPREDNLVRLFFVQRNERKKADISNLKSKKEDSWANYLKAVLYGFLAMEFKISGMDVTVYSELLPVRGFGIYSAMKAGCALAVKKAFRLNCSDAQLLQVLEKANRNFLKIDNLIADNFTALFSEPNSVVLTDYSKQSYEMIPLNFEGYKIILTDAGVPDYESWKEETVREMQNALLLGDLKDRKRGVLGGWVYNTNPTEMNLELSVVSEDMRRKLLYIIYEHGCILDAVDGIKKGKFTKFARAVNKSHTLLRENYNVSCPEIDWILKRVSELEPNLQDIREPVTCGRIIGNGVGGSLYAFVRSGDVETYKKSLLGYARIFGLEPLMYEVKGAKGAHSVRMS